MPLYLEYFLSGKSVEQNICLNFLNEFAPLYREVDFLLREEFREVENYYAILLVISSGSATNNEIAKKTGIDLVGLRDDNWTDIGECKWGVIRSTKAVIRELESKIDHYPNYRNATIGPRIFTRKKINNTSSVREDIKWHCLEDLYLI